MFDHDRPSGPFGDGKLPGLPAVVFGVPKAMSGERRYGIEITSRIQQHEGTQLQVTDVQ